MRVAHFADLHLGRRQFYRANSAGVNLRESDTALAFRSAIDHIEIVKPDLILCAGDVFHSIQPSNLARLDAFRGFKRLATVAPVLVVAGNHSTPRSVEHGCPVDLLGEIPNVFVATRKQGQWVSPDGSVGVCLMPHAALYRGEVPRRPGAPTEILLIHGATAGLAKLTEHSQAAFVETPTAEWSYVALGDYHVCRQVAANAWYPGSLEYVSSNPWGELKEEGGRGKGWLLVSLEPGRAPVVEFRPVPTRRHVDLPPIDGTDRSVNDLMTAVLGYAGAIDPWDGVVARQLVIEVDRQTRRALVTAPVLKDLATRALHFRLDVRLAPRQSVQVAGMALDDREPWEIAQDQEAEYWDGREHAATEPSLPALPVAYQPDLDPYFLNVPEPLRHIA